MLSRLSYLAAAFVMIIVPAATASAQQPAASFDELRSLVKPGDVVTITVSSGQTLKGRIADISSSSVDVFTDHVRRTLGEFDVATIKQRRHGSLGWGVAGGGLTGAAIGALVGAVGFAQYGYAAEGAVFGAGVFGGIGAGIGLAVSAVPHTRVVFSKPRATRAKLMLAPVLTPRRHAVQLSYAF